MAEGWYDRRGSRPRVRLLVVTRTLCGGGFASRLVLDAQGDVGDSYGAAITIQFWAYTAGLAALGAWAVAGAVRDRQTAGCAIWLIAAFAAGMAFISSRPF